MHGDTVESLKRQYQHHNVTERGHEMKKIAPYIVLFLFALVAWEALVEPYGVNFVFDGDGPFEAMLALVLAGGGLVIGVLAAVIAAVVVAVVFAGLGLLAVVGLVLAALVVVAVVAPFLLPVLIPLAIVWFIVSRNRRNRLKQQAV